MISNNLQKDPTASHSARLAISLEPRFIFEKNSFSPLQLGFSCFSSQDEQFWEQGLKAGSCSPCTLQNQNSSLLLFILFLSSLHFAANETWKTPLVLCRFLVEMCTASLLLPALLPLYGSAAMINTHLSCPRAGGCPSSLLWGGIPVMDLQQKEGKAPLLFFLHLPIFDSHSAAEWRMNFLDTY